MYAGLLLPFQGHKYTKKKKEITAIEHILTESLKQSNDIIKNVVHFINDLSAFDDIMKIHRDVKEEEGRVVSPEDTLKIAHALRSIGPQLNAICLLHVARTYTLSVPHKQQKDETPSQNDINIDALRKILGEHEEVIGLIDDLRLTNVHLLKPIINGQTVMELYGCKPGKHLKAIIEQCLNH